MSSVEYNIGDKLSLVKGKEGFVRYKGELDGRDGIYYGIEVTLGKGKHSGKYKKKRYFECIKGKGLFVENKHIITKINDNISHEENLKPKKSKTSKKKQKSKSKAKAKPKQTDTENINTTNTSRQPKKEKKEKKEKKDKKKKAKKQKTVLELAADDAWGSSSDSDQKDDEKKQDSPPPHNISNTTITTITASKPKKKTKKKIKSKPKAKEIIHSVPAIYVSDQKKKKKYTKKVEIVDEVYIISERFIHQRHSLTITATGKLLCHPWQPKTHKKGGIIRIQCVSQIVIQKDGILSATGRGWFGQFGIGNAEKLKHYNVFGGASYGSQGMNYYDHNTKTLLSKGQTYGKSNLIKLYAGSGNKYLKGGGIIELIAPLIINEGVVECNGGGGCSGGSIFICCEKFVNNGNIVALGGKKTSFCGKAGNGRIAIYCNQYENNGRIVPKPYLHKIQTKKQSEESKESIYEIGMDIVSNRESIKMNVIHRQKNKKSNFLLSDDAKMDQQTALKQRECKKAVEKIVNMLMKCEEKITNPVKEVYDKLNINKETQTLLSTEIGFGIMEKHRKLYNKTVFREQMIIARLVLELKFCKLLSSISFMEFSVINKATQFIFDSNTMATMRYTNGRIEPFNEILPRVCWRLSYSYLDIHDKIKKIKSDFKFREKSLETKICLWEFEGKEILSYEILIKVDRTKDKYESVLKNLSFAQQKAVNIASFYQLDRDKLCRCGFLRIEHSAKLYPKAWYSDTKEGGRITIECIDLVCFGCIDVSQKGKYGKYGKGAGQMKKDKRKKKRNAKRKVNKSNENDDYYFGANYVGGQNLKDLIFGCGITGKKHFKGGGIIDLYVSDHFINYGILSSDGSLSSSGGSIFICCKLFINYGTIQCLGGKEILEKSGKGENGKIAIYTKVFENHGKILPQTNIYIGSFEEGMEIFLNRQAAKRKN